MRILFLTLNGIKLSEKLWMTTTELELVKVNFVFICLQIFGFDIRDTTIKSVFL